MEYTDITRLTQTTRYHVEVQEPGRDWVQVHPSEWEDHAAALDAAAYAEQVRNDYPAGSTTRVVQTITMTAQRVEMVLPAIVA